MNSLLTYQDRKPEDLIAHPLNPRKHPSRQTTALAGSIEKNGWLKPVVVNDRTGRILDGHARVEYALDKGLPAVPCIIIDVPEAQERRILRDLDRIGELREIEDGKLLALLKVTLEEDGDLGDSYDEEDYKKLALALAGMDNPREDPDAPQDFPAFDETIDTNNECPKCGYRWSAATA